MKQPRDTSPAMIVCKALFLVLLFACLLYYLIHNFLDRSGGFSGIEPQKLENWTVTDGGATYHADDPYADRPKPGVAYTITTTLPEQFEKDNFLCFLYFNDFEVYVDGELRKSFVRDRDVHLIGGSAKANYLLMTIPKEDAGKTLTIKRIRGTTDPRVYPGAMLGTPEEIYKYLVHEYGAVFVMYLVIYVISALIIICGIILSIWLKIPIDMMYAGFAGLISTAWMITDSYLYPLLYGHEYIDGPVSYLLCMMIPMPILAYMNGLQKHRYEKWYVCAEVFSLLSFFTFTILHYTGIFPFNESLPYVDASIGVVSAICVAIMVYDIVKGHFVEYKYTAIGFLGFIFFGLVQIVVIFALNLNNDGIVLLIGLLFWLAMIVWQQLQQLRDSDLEKKRAMELSDAKTRFLAGMSHEIRTPINSILGMNEMILRESKDPAIDSYAGSIQSAGKMLLALVNDVLDFSKIEAGRLDLQPVEYRMNELLNDLDSIIRERANSKGLDFAINVAQSVPDGLYGDDVRIKQILINLLTNAVKYTEHGSVNLSVDSESVSEGVCLLRFAVMDTGIGIREEDRKTLFDAFTRADMAQNRNVEGTGLGLAIVKRTVDAMDGEIRVDSAYGKGSVFTVLLPMDVVDASPVCFDPKASAGSLVKETYRVSFRAPGAKILVVDDNAANLSIVRQFLKETQVTIVCCMDGNEALKCCEQEKFDLILLDHMMPDPDGIETLRMIRRSERSLNQDTKAVMLTANAVAGSRQLYLDAGFADYLAKPVRAVLLEETVRKYLQAGSPASVNSRTSAPESADFADFAGPADTGLTDFAGPADTGFAGTAGPADPADLAGKWDAIPEMDYAAALDYCGGAEVIVLVAEEIVKDSTPRLDRMKEALEKQDYDLYRIEAHAIKSNLATLGITDLSERARAHEFAAKENNIDFILSDQEGFMQAYEDLCNRLKDCI